jgi:hypothetical protein
MGGETVLNRRMDLAGHRIQEELGYSPERPTRGIGGSVECLGMTFESDGARREYFLERLREKLKDPEFRKIEGFPIGSDEDILALSDPPYYTACPNPFVLAQDPCQLHDAGSN